jgi:hypothetical protein
VLIANLGRPSAAKRRDSLASSSPASPSRCCSSYFACRCFDCRRRHEILRASTRFSKLRYCTRSAASPFFPLLYHLRNIYVNVFAYALKYARARFIWTRPRPLKRTLYLLPSPSKSTTKLFQNTALPAVPLNIINSPLRLALPIRIFFTHFPYCYSSYVTRYAFPIE